MKSKLTRIPRTYTRTYTGFPCKHHLREKTFLVSPPDCSVKVTFREFVPAAYKEILAWYDSRETFLGTWVGCGSSVITDVILENGKKGFANITRAWDPGNERRLQGVSLKNITESTDTEWYAHFTFNQTKYTTRMCTRTLAAEYDTYHPYKCSMHDTKCTSMPLWFWMSGVTIDGGLVLYCNEPDALCVYFFKDYFLNVAGKSGRTCRTVRTCTK